MGHEKQLNNQQVDLGFDTGSLRDPIKNSGNRNKGSTGNPLAYDAGHVQDQLERLRKGGDQSSVNSFLENEGVFSGKSELLANVFADDFIMTVIRPEPQLLRAFLEKN